MSDRAVSPPRRDTLKELKEAEADLQAARQEAAAAQSRVAELERKANDVRVKVSAARSMALLSVRPRRLVIAYALWLFTPLIWPGAYLFYLGRDTHAVLHTVSLGGFGIGWLLDAFYIPLYVADHNSRLVTSIASPAGSVASSVSCSACWSRPSPSPCS